MLFPAPPFLWKMTERKKSSHKREDKLSNILVRGRARKPAATRKNAMRSVLLLQLIHIHIHNIFIILQGGDDDF